MTDNRLPRLLQLASPTLPVGAYSYSQGLESATAAGIVVDRLTAENWIGDLLEYSIAFMEAPVLLRMIDSWQRSDYAAFGYWNALLLASRETAELRGETVQTGYSLRKLLTELEGMDEKALAYLVGIEEISFPAAFAIAVAQWKVPAEEAVVAYLWAWLENQVIAAVKTVPLGQTEGQRMLLGLGNQLVAVAERASLIPDDDLGTFAPQLAILSSQHETQYSRLFRS